MHSQLLFVAAAALVALGYTPDVDPNKPYPHTTEEGQYGFNDCNNGNSPSSNCQTLIINSLDDFCLWAPPNPSSTIGDTESVEVAYCTKSGHGTRLIPSGTFAGAHYIQTPSYIQITGTGDFTKSMEDPGAYEDSHRINIQAGDAGGELDPHGATGNGNPIGGLVFANVYGNGLQQIKEWTQFIGSDEFCIRVCFGDRASEFCNHVYDRQGCIFNIPSSYQNGFDTCDANNVAEPMGVYGTSTWYQGQEPTPTAQPPAATSNCVSGRQPGANYFVIAEPTPAPSRKLLF